MKLDREFRTFVLAVAGAALLILATPVRAQDEDSGSGDDDLPEAVPPAPATTPEMDAEELARADREDQLSYDPRGRRDPFRALTGGVHSDEERMKYTGTLRGLLWTEVKLTAILKSPNGNIATFEGGVKKTGYFAREGERFWNAIVHDIDYNNGTVTIREELDDPRLLKPYRDHPISLFPAGQAPRGLNLMGSTPDDAPTDASTSPLGTSKVVTSKRVPGGY